MALLPTNHVDNVHEKINAATINAIADAINKIRAPVFDLSVYAAVGDNSAVDTQPLTDALAAASSAGGGIVRGERGKIYKTAGGHTIPKNVWLHDIFVNHTGNNACFLYDGKDVSVGYSDDRVRGGLERCRIYGNSGASAWGLEIRNCQDWTVRDTIIGNNINSANCYTAGGAILVHNDVYWVENLDLDNIYLASNAIGIGYLRETGAAASLEYHRYRAVSISCTANQVGMDLGMTGVGTDGNGAFGITNGNLDVNIWLQGNNAIGVKVRSGCVIDESTWFHLHGEALNAATGTLYVSNAGTFKPRGRISFPYGSPLPSAVVNSTTDLTGGLKSRTDIYTGSQVLVYEAFPIWAAGSVLTMVSGHLYAELVGLKGGDVASSVIVFINGGSVAAGLTLVKVALYSSSGTLLASSADNKANFTGNNTYITTSFTTPYIVPTESQGGYYAAILAVGTTPPKLNSAASFGAGAVGVSPSGSGAAMCRQMTSQTDIPSPATFGSDGQPFYLAVA